MWLFNVGLFWPITSLGSVKAVEDPSFVGVISGFADLFATKRGTSPSGVSHVALRWRNVLLKGSFPEANFEAKRPYFLFFESKNGGKNRFFVCVVKN